MLSLVVLVAAVAVLFDGVAGVCQLGDREYQEGEVFPLVPGLACVVMRCENGDTKEIRGECVDSYRRCHPIGTTWAQGCKAYRCEKRVYKDESGMTWTVHDPVKIRDC